MLLSIAGSKVFCYFVYWLVFSWAFVVEEGEPIFLLVQVVVTLLLSLTAWYLNYLKNKNLPSIQS
jgi:hypothetical protein